MMKKIPIGALIKWMKTRMMKISFHSVTYQTYEVPIDEKHNKVDDDHIKTQR
ncbi:hypothetical protein ACDX78_04830 [Virgibacillus oceani]